jgi:hypothetical protein
MHILKLGLGWVIYIQVNDETKLRNVVLGFTLCVYIMMEKLTTKEWA